MTTVFGTGDYRYQLIEEWPDWPINGVASDVVTDSSGNVFVAVRTLQTPEQNTGTILVFDDKGNFLSRFGDEYFATPHGLWINSHDEIWFADSGNHAVRKFDRSGKLIMTLGTPNELGDYGTPFRSPTRAVESDDGDIFVADGYWQNKVHRFDSHGAHITTWGEGEPVFKKEAWELYKSETCCEATGIPGNGPGQFNLPHDVTVDNNKNVYIMDRQNNRCQIFDADGIYMREWSDIRGPNDAVIIDDNVMVVAEGTGSILIITLEGEVIDRWGQRGEELGEFRGYPHGIWIDNNQAIYVAEVGADKALQKFVRI